ncbi:uncharacterized protein LOC126969213 isoform X5 [Leptidea sinapis]|uniref:uncharacterized protein LOC126969213 isoform X5 n=1 Tax=Leptidea sinapis TaxID=189913 RepID=UPI0021C4A508|nr:uncharacterized protein LOC126969213 isoform X5 [Leptidea sinapis]
MFYVSVCDEWILPVKGDEDEQEEFQEEDDNIELDWLLPESDISKNNQQVFPTPEDLKDDGTCDEAPTDNDYGSMKDTIINFSEGQCSQVSDNYSAQFLSMPDLDSEPNDDNSGVELLAEFNICNDMDQGIAKKKSDRDYNNSLNCVLPSVSEDQTDEMNLVETSDETNYNGEWDQMFCDIIGNKSSSQDSVSNLKELYSQISHTIDLLNS